MRTFSITMEATVTHTFEVDAFSDMGATDKAQALFDQLDFNKADKTTVSMLECDDVTDYRRCAA